MEPLTHKTKPHTIPKPAPIIKCPIRLVAFAVILSNGSVSGRRTDATKVIISGQEIEQLWPPELLRGASDEATFFAAKGKVLDILNVLYGEKSREFRVVKLTCSPGTVVKVVNHIIRRSDMNSPSSKVVNL